MKLDYLTKTLKNRPRFRVRLLKHNPDPMVASYPRITIVTDEFSRWGINGRDETIAYKDALYFVRVSKFYGRTIFRKVSDGAIIIREPAPDDIKCSEDVVVYRTWWNKETIPHGWEELRN
jgi:hypothetical protein